MTRVDRGRRVAGCGRKVRFGGCDVGVAVVGAGGRTRLGILCVELRRWVNGGGKVLPGLVARREAEVALVV